MKLKIRLPIIGLVMLAAAGVSAPAAQAEENSVSAPTVAVNQFDCPVGFSSPTIKYTAPDRVSLSGGIIITPTDPTSCLPMAEAKYILCSLLCPIIANGTPVAPEQTQSVQQHSSALPPAGP